MTEAGDPFSNSLILFLLLLFFLTWWCHIFHLDVIFALSEYSWIKQKLCQFSFQATKQQIVILFFNCDYFLCTKI